jgi:hypothetical protein
MAINGVGPGSVFIPSVTTASTKAATTTAVPARLSLFQNDTFETTGSSGTTTGTSAEEDKKNVDNMIFQKMFDMAEKARKDRAADNDPWK